MGRVLLAMMVVVAACSGAEAAPVELTPEPPIEATMPSTPTTTTTTTVAETLTTIPAAVDPFRTYVAWMPGGLDPGFGEALLALEGSRSVVVARTGTLHIVRSADAAGTTIDEPPPGFVIPVEAVVFERTNLAPFVPAEVSALFRGLQPDELVLSTSSARLRRIGVGGSITFEGGIELTVAGVVPDGVLGRAEVALASRDAFAVDNTVWRFALVESSASAAAIEAGLRASLAPDTVVRVRDRDPVRSDAARAVQPQVVIKEEFGEFAFRPPRRGSRFEIDPAWVEANIVTVSIPLLGRTRCHKRFAATLTSVMQSLVDDGLEDVIDRSSFRGCWNPRFIAGTTRLSRHAFGAAADINFGNPPDGGPGSPTHPELLARMEAAGITSGHAWSAPDPGHFEFYEDPGDIVVP